MKFCPLRYLFRPLSKYWGSFLVESNIEVINSYISFFRLSFYVDLIDSLMNEINAPAT